MEFCPRQSASAIVYSVPCTKFQALFDWQGTPDPTAWICIGDSIRWCAALLPGGLAALQNANRQLAIEARRILCKTLEIEAPCPESVVGSMATLPLPERLQTVEANGNPIDFLQTSLLAKFQIEVSIFPWGKSTRRFFRASL